ncbi:helix-turn-helix domain-containing protein [Salmonella enterica]|nr:helix-turn-helix domain-containing protein [Salmonella enterica]EGX8464217.1 helix-turn-helix domain-containing protein [Salmonella enterica]EGX8517626.1 helix-turn-helix domain-containing protein [Salmonella enterica]EHG6942333.1 helix-turn-helix domain-containing protein [Salmonella enterica]EHO9498211.1 helix-turn-helix domain-containing protein [Salmonella enterica]
MSTKNAQKEQKKESLITTHWGDDATIHGWTAIPNSLLMLQGDLGIGSTEMCILLNILMHQWPESGESISFPSIGTIASRIGVSKRTIQRGVSNLEALGILTRYQSTRNDPLTNGANIFDSTPLKEYLNKKAKGITISNSNKKKERKKTGITPNIKLPRICPKCLKTKATSHEEIVKFFGVRKTMVGEIINSYCKECRASEKDLF